MGRYRQALAVTNNFRFSLAKISSVLACRLFITARGASPGLKCLCGVSARVPRRCLPSDRRVISRTRPRTWRRFTFRPGMPIVTILCEFSRHRLIAGDPMRLANRGAVQYFTECARAAAIVLLLLSASAAQNPAPSQPPIPFSEDLNKYPGLAPELGRLTDDLKREV